mmetsp:Transcript_29120/g.28170  ORF Transcript_29120/g.28170 Transcript_29120/m.28170 type:complete len:111 (+) Transcript_29120:2576-2908(+)
MNVEKKAKLKFLASALLFTTFLEKKVQENQQRAFLSRWRNNVYLTKIAESAFSKVLELNHKHSFARFKAGSFLLKSVVKQSTKNDLKNSFKELLEFVRFNSLKQQAALFS